MSEESGVDEWGVGSGRGERGEQSQEGVVHMTGEDAGSDPPVLPATTSAMTTWLTIGRGITHRITHPDPIWTWRFIRIWRRRSSMQ